MAAFGVECGRDLRADAQDVCRAHSVPDIGQVVKLEVNGRCRQGRLQRHGTSSRAGLCNLDEWRHISSGRVVYAPNLPPQRAVQDRAVWRQLQHLNALVNLRGN